MENTRSVDTLIFSALSPDISKMGPIYDALKEFCETKQAEDPSDRFNIILFQEDGPNYLDDFTLYPDHLLIALKSLEPMIVRANVSGGILTAITFIIDVFKKISDKCFRLIVLTDKGSLRIPDQYIPVLENLINQVKDMPFFIDIVRLDIDDPREDLKLMKLARRCNGDIHEINDIRSLSSILQVLAIKREITAYGGFSEDKPEIDEESRPFFENLADEPIEVTEDATCAICFQKDIKWMVKCPKCETTAHKTCWSHWAKNSNIGIPYLFRCHSCYNLIKLEKDFVKAVQEGKTPSEEVKVDQVETVDALAWLKSLETDDGPKIVQTLDPLALSEDDYEAMGQEIQFEEDEVISVDDDFTPLSDDELQIVWCPSCNKITTNEYKKCPSCGETL